ncbi:tripartite tricarboxylate transporter substrate binding protein [Bordetella hinzii]|uniref:Bug family tripartite tricarboxylate transporter substrate binding protein n=1 Tax=Bordetella hinzii TaxID=103855 RepID=UPI0013EFFFF8|nr:tripartite tricarboxylate transporter substrate binding protein [Bordetella hinzii]QII86570.1 tripartite tricarboxylate transporter substrate binding protein [Bordetella hinzii]
MQMRAQMRRRVLAALAGLPVVAGLARAEPAWPTQPVKIVVTQGPGSGSDVLARLIAQYLGQSLGQSVIVENKLGGGGVVGHEAVLRSHDDHTFVFSSTAPLFVVPYLNKAAVYRYHDFAPVAPVMQAPFVVLVPDTEDAPRSLKELIASLRDKPQAYSSAGYGTMTHLASQLLLQAAGVTATHVPYKGSGASLNDLIGRQVAFSSDSLTASMPLIKAGRLRALAVTGAAREKSLPEVPTLQEAGYPGLSIAVIGGLFAPKAGSEAANRRLAAAMAEVMDNTAVRQRFATLETEPLTVSRQAFAALLDKEEARWEAAARQLGPEPD